MKKCRKSAVRLTLKHQLLVSVRGDVMPAEVPLKCIVDDEDVFIEGSVQLVDDGHRGLTSNLEDVGWS